MKILLTRPWNTTSMLIPNHGLGYLSTALKRRGHKVRILDCIRDGVSARRFATIVREESFDVIGFQVYTFDLAVLGEYLEALSGNSAVVVAGGPHPSSAPESFMRKFPRVDYGFRGEAEESLPGFIELLSREPAPPVRDLERVPGLIFRHEGAVRVNPPQFTGNLDSLGFPDWEQISPPSYPVAPQGTFTKQLPYAPIIITRGCPYLCTFCAGKIISGRFIRTRSVAHVMEELRFLKDKYDIREFHVQDDNFTFDKNYVMRFCEALLNSGMKFSWACPNGIRLDSLDKEMLQAMEAAGCYSVAVGIESGSQRVLDMMKKNATVNDLIAKINLIRKTTSWYITGFFILGYPGETESEMWRTIRLSRRLPLDKANFGILMPLPGTDAERAAMKMGWQPDRDLHRMSEYRSPFTPEGISPWKFRWLFRYAFIGFYARPRIIMRFIGQIKSRDQFKILFHRFMDVVKP